MSVHGPSSLPIRPYVPAPVAAPRPAAAEPAPAAGAAAPAESSLWDVLTDEERAFFSQQASLGALTYGRGRAAAAPPANAAPLGGRIDVRG